MRFDLRDSGSGESRVGESEVESRVGESRVVSGVVHRIGIGSEHECSSLHTVKRQVDRSSKNPIGVQGGLRLQSGVTLHDSSIEVQSALSLHKSSIEVQSDFMLHKSSIEVPNGLMHKLDHDQSS